MTADGTFDSAKEFQRWTQLRLEEKAGRISLLRRQVPFTLLHSQKGPTRTERPVKYIADFVYEQDGKLVVEDVKGLRTREYVLKRKLMLYIHGIEIREV